MQGHRECGTGASRGCTHPASCCSGAAAMRRLGAAAHRHALSPLSHQHQATQPLRRPAASTHGAVLDAGVLNAYVGPHTRWTSAGLTPGPFGRLAAKRTGAGEGGMQGHEGCGTGPSGHGGHQQRRRTVRVPEGGMQGLRGCETGSRGPCWAPAGAAHTPSEAAAMGRLGQWQCQDRSVRHTLGMPTLLSMQQEQ
jgi:hypothetical protein